MLARIYGLGWVGKSMLKLFPDSMVEDPVRGYTSQGPADVAIVCVPTPNVNCGALDCSIVEEVIRQCPEPLVLLRSTVMPGTCDRLAKETGKHIVFQPEYLGETVDHPLFDQGSRTFMILGGRQDDRARIIELYQRVYNAGIRIEEVTNYEAEIIKLSENRAIAFKVAQCQELYDVCIAAGVNYNTIRQRVYGDDPRFNLLWTFVYPEARGFNSKCIPKDVYAWASWAESLGYSPTLTNAMLEVNRQYLARRAGA